MAWRWASWEITDPSLRTRFNPCGRRWVLMRSCYTFPMRLYIGGVEATYPARWFWCYSIAQFPAMPHGLQASPWLRTGEVNKVWGEVTPYPTDPTASFIRGLDRGLNPGYPGQAVIGDPQWFIDGQLPADILAGPIPPMPDT